LTGVKQWICGLTNLWMRMTSEAFIMEDCDWVFIRGLILT